MSTTSGTIRASASSMSIRSCGRRRRRRSRRCSSAANAPSLDGLCPRDGLDAPDLRPAPPALADHNYTDDMSASCSSSTSSAPARCRPGKGRYILVNAAAAAALHVRRRQAGRFDGRRGRQAQISDADDDRLHPLRQPQPLLVRAARPRRPSGSRPTSLKQGLKYLDELGYQVLSDWTPNATDHRSQDDRLEGVADGKVEVLHPPEARARTIRWAG